MRILREFPPTPEQLQVIQSAPAGFTIVTGAAGSGKTSTALLRLRFLINYWRQRRDFGRVTGDIRVLVLTFNRTLRGYIAGLAKQQIDGTDLTLQVTTFSKWAYDLMGAPRVFDDADRIRILKKLGDTASLRPEFIIDEVDYVLGRFPLGRREDYLAASRAGRGRSPRMPVRARQWLLSQVVDEYEQLKRRHDLLDWHDLAGVLSQERRCEPYHIVVVDESQDFTLNQMRAVLNHLQDEHTVTLVLDTAQRIYPYGFNLSELGITPAARYTLQVNHRNTREIAAFCKQLIEGMDLGDDASMPNFDRCVESGEVPVMVRARFSRQMDWIIERIRDRNGRDESVAILHPLGGRWFSYVRRRLAEAGIPFVDLTRRSEWPAGNEEVAVSTMASAKGLEFDHVCMVGLNAEVLQHGAEEGDDREESLRRLLAMAGGRARRTLMLGCKPGEATELFHYLDPETYEVVE